MNDITCWLRRLPALLALTVIAACGGGGSAGDEQASASPLRLDAAKSVTQTLGPAGGTLSTTAADGTAYTLNVPPKALRKATAITLTPIASIADLPAGVALAGGAHLAPEGQRFDVPLTLSVVLAAAPASAPRPFTYDGELQQRHLYPATVSGSTIAFEIVHFSGYAVLVGMLDGALGYFPSPSARGDQALQELVEAGILGLDAPAARDAAMRNALQGWLDDFIRPEVDALAALQAYNLDAFMSGRVAALSNELRSFVVALKFALLQGSADAFTALQHEFQLEVALAAHTAINLSNAGCSAFGDQAVLLIAPDILAWQALAQQADAAEIASLERPAVLQALCVQPVFDPQNPVTFAADAAGQSAPLTARAGYSINDAPARFDLPMSVSSAGTSNVTPGTLDIAEIGAGQTYARLFHWDAGAPSVRIDVSTCFGEESLREVCQQAFVVRGTPADTCPLFKMTVPGKPTASTRDFGGLSLGYESGGGAIGGDDVLSLTAFNGSLTAESILHYRVETSPITQAAVDIVVHWTGDATVEAGAASVSLAVNGVGASDSRTSSGPLLLSIPVTVRHNDLLKLTFSGSATSPAADKNVNPRGSMHTNNFPAGVSLRVVQCQE